jgi:hypothetical protein
VPAIDGVELNVNSFAPRSIQSIQHSRFPKEALIMRRSKHTYRFLLFIGAIICFNAPGVLKAETKGVVRSTRDTHAD